MRDDHFITGFLNPISENEPAANAPARRRRIDFGCFLFYLKNVGFRASISLFFAILILLSAYGSYAQTDVPTSAPGKTIFRDSDGNLISNDEFVDIRMANFQYRDATIIKSYDDGTVEFRTQKIPQEGMTAPSFDVTTLDGTRVSLDSLQGTVIVLNFWFIGCPACRGMEPKLNAFMKRFEGNGDVLFIAMTYDNARDLRRYLSKERFDYRQVADAESTLKSFVVSGYPKNLVIGREGRIVYWRSTIHAWDKFESVIRNELTAK